MTHLIGLSELRATIHNKNKCIVFRTKLNTKKNEDIK